MAAFVPVAVLVAVFPQDWVSGLILSITAPIVPLFMIIVGKGAESLSQRQWRRLALMGAHFFDVIEGLTTLKLFNASRREAETIARISDDYRKTTMEVLRVAFLSSLVLEFFATVSVAMVAVYIGFRLLAREMDFLPGFFALLLAPEFYRPLREMGAQHHARMEAIGAADGLIACLSAPLPEPRRVAPRGRPRRLAGERLHIAFEGVGFAHGEDAPAPCGGGHQLYARPGRMRGPDRPERRGQDDHRTAADGFPRAPAGAHPRQWRGSA